LYNVVPEWGAKLWQPPLSPVGEPQREAICCEWMTTLSITVHAAVDCNTRLHRLWHTRTHIPIWLQMAAIFFSVDVEKGKVLVYAGVPAALVAKVKAGEWVATALAVVGGKGGGKPTAAQGQGPDIAKVPEAIMAAAQFAAAKL
jgi:hypothetical protein